MSKKISLRKTYSVYASKTHLATMTFPFIKRELKKGAIIKTIFEKAMLLKTDSKNDCRGSMKNLYKEDELQKIDENDCNG